MADKLKAIGAYRPRIKLGRMIQMDQLEPYIVARTSLNEGELHNVLRELCDAVIYFGLDGRSVKLEYLGVYTPKIALNGKLSIAHRLNNSLKRRLNDEGKFKGDVINNDMVGKSVDDLIARWNEEHPDDPVEL